MFKGLILLTVCDFDMCRVSTITTFDFKHKLTMAISLNLNVLLTAAGKICLINVTIIKKG